jgi:hypothetical protein
MEMAKHVLIRFGRNAIVTLIAQYVLIRHS